MFGSSEFLYDRFERTKSAVKRAPYITAAVIGIILLIICLLAVFHYSGTKDQSSPAKVVNSTSLNFDADKNTLAVPTIGTPKLQKPKPQEQMTAEMTSNLVLASNTTFKYLTLFDAVTYGEPEDVLALIEKGVNLNKQNDIGETALHMAIKRGFDNIAQILIEHGANGNIQSKNGLSSLGLALKTDRQDIAHLILDDANFGIASWNKDVLGHKACNVSDKLADAFLKKGIDIKGDMKEEVLQAIYRDDVNKTQLILENCYGSVNGNKDIQPLFAAAEKCNVNVARMLIFKGANVDHADPANWRPIHVASYNGCEPVVQLLIDNDADVNATLRIGLSPLCIAIDQCHLGIVESLQKVNAIMQPKCELKCKVGQQLKEAPKNVYYKDGFKP